MKAGKRRAWRMWKAIVLGGLAGCGGLGGWVGGVGCGPSQPWLPALSAAAPAANPDGTLGPLGAKKDPPPGGFGPVTGADAPRPAMMDRAPLVWEESAVGTRFKLADCYAFIACASADNPAGRYSPAAYVESGLTKIVDDQMLPLYAKGWRRFYVDSPFGKDTDAKGQPQFTYFGAQRGSADSPWRKGFATAWRRITARPGVKVVAYMGNPYADPEFKLIAADPTKRERVLTMLRGATQPLIDAGFQGLGIDARFSSSWVLPVPALLLGMLPRSSSDSTRYCGVCVATG